MKLFKIIILYPLHYIIFLKIYFFFKLLSYESASNLGSKLFKFLGPKTKVNVTALNNIKNIFNNKDNKFTSNIVKKSWENLGRTMAEFSHLNTITNNFHIKVNGENLLKKIANEKKQVIFIAIHQSNWEILAPTIAKYGIKLNSVYRHINNPFINKFILNIRKNIYKSSKSILSPKGKKSAKDMIESINRGFSIALLVDQKDSSGPNIPLLGKPAKTQIGFIKLSKKFNLEIYPVENRRCDQINFEITIHEPIKKISEKNENNEIEIMKKIHTIIGNWIIKLPENWLWQHKRWD